LGFISGYECSLAVKKSGLLGAFHLVRFKTKMDANVLSGTALRRETVMNIALPTTWEERLQDLGNIPASRIRTQPAPGTATVEDVTYLRDTERRLYELIDGTLVEKSMGWQESLLAGILLQWLNNYLDSNRLGVATGADGMTRLFGDTVRGPDVAFVAWNRMPHGRIPTDPIPELVPNLVIEVLSTSNTYAEMSRKRREYFQAGVELLWMVEHRTRSVTVFRSAQDATVYEGESIIDGGKVLPGWQVDIAELFSRLDSKV
jgi:Uma2 family endonuclease